MFHGTHGDLVLWFYVSVCNAIWVTYWWLHTGMRRVTLKLTFSSSGFLLCFCDSVFHSSVILWVTADRGPQGFTWLWKVVVVGDSTSAPIKRAFSCNTTLFFVQIMFSISLTFFTAFLFCASYLTIIVKSSSSESSASVVCLCFAGSIEFFYTIPFHPEFFSRV